MEPQTNFENQNLDQNKNIYKILFFVSLGLFLVVSSVLTTLLITQKSSKLTQTTDNQETEVIPSETETESITSTQTETTPTKPATTSSIPKDWKTYTDSTYKFSISYPSDWIFNKTKEGISLETPEYKKEIERQTEELKQSGFSGEGPNASGRYFISCFQSLTDLKNSNFSSAITETNKTSLYNFLLENSYSNSNNMSGLKYFLNLKTININSLTSYQVENEGPVPSLSVFIQNKSLSICKIDLSGITTEKLSEIESKFINTFKFN